MICTWKSFAFVKANVSGAGQSAFGKRPAPGGPATASISDSSIADFACNNAANERDRGVPMRLNLSAVAAVALLAGVSTAWSACLPGQARNCINFDAVPQIAQQIVAAEPAAAPTKTVRPVDDQKPYTGPTVGTAPNLRRAPTVGYKWAIN